MVEAGESPASRCSGCPASVWERSQAGHSWRYCWLALWSQNGDGESRRWFRGGLVFKAHRPVYHSNLGSRVIKKKKKRADLAEASSQLRQLLGALQARQRHVQLLQMRRDRKHRPRLLRPLRGTPRHRRPRFRHLKRNFMSEYLTECRMSREGCSRQAVRVPAEGCKHAQRRPRFRHLVQR